MNHTCNSVTSKRGPISTGHVLFKTVSRSPRYCPPLIGHCQASRWYIPEQVICPSTPNNCGGVPNRNSNPAAQNNPGYHRTACSSPYVGHLLGKYFRRVLSRFSGSRRGCNRPRPRTPPSRGTNCLAAQRAPEHITPPVMRVLVLTGDRLPYSLSSGGPFGSGPNRITPPHLAPSVGTDAAMARGGSSYQNVGSRATRSRQSRGDSRRRSPPVDVAIAPAGANHDVPAPAVAAPATTLEVAELRGQMQQLTGVCLTLQVQLAGAAAPAVSLQRERQAESSHRRSRAPPAPQEQQADSPHRSHRAPSEERVPERRGRSPRRSVASPRLPRSVVGGNSRASGRGGPANSEQELARRLRRVGQATAR
ncbi:hypothetical protein Taro_023086 [Colocasia esculenta]|uniref:Uncharacterized protein n=1 Tax=Colocasia esculenta TaxID=4460 RepID=A0A843V796_COLES|nr:hypothetical protein [Colocasia esculenta]